MILHRVKLKKNSFLLLHFFQVTTVFPSFSESGEHVIVKFYVEANILKKNYKRARLFYFMVIFTFSNVKYFIQLYIYNINITVSYVKGQFLNFVAGPVKRLSQPCGLPSDSFIYGVTTPSLQQMQIYCSF